MGPEGTPSNVPDETKTKILAHPYVEPGYYEYRDQSAPILKGAAKEQITLRLPENMKVGDIKWLSVWCRKFSVDFGNLIFPTDLNVRLSHWSCFTDTFTFYGYISLPLTILPPI